MSEQVITNISENNILAKDALERARVAHEKYLIRQNNKDLEEAINNYIEAIKLDPSLPETYYRLAGLMWEQGQISVSTAIEQCKTAISLAPKNVNAHLYAGYFLSLANDIKDAEKEFKNAIDINALTSARPRLILSMSILNRISNKNAKPTDFAKFLYYFLSGSLMIMWDYPTLKMLYKSLTEDVSVFSYKTLGAAFEKIKMTPMALQAYEKGIKKTEHEDVFYHRLGDLALESNNLDESLECYEKALEATPFNRDLLVKIATILQTYYPERIDEAIDYYNKLLEFNIDNDKIYYELGHLYLRKEDKLHAVASFKLALDQNPENPFYNNSLAYAFVKAELYDDAIEYYQKAIKLNPDKEWTAIVCHALGAIYAEVKGNFEAAEATFQAGAILDPKNSDILLSMGDLCMAQGNLDNAIRHYCDAITTNPEDFQAYSKAGLALWEKDYIEEAIVAFHKALAINPESEVSANNLGVIYLDGVGIPEEALPFFEQAIEINPNYTLAYYNAGRSLQALGDTTLAANYYQMALDLNKVTEELDSQEVYDRLHGLFE